MFRKIVAFLHARAKAALIQPQSEREAVLTGREPPQGNGAFCENLSLIHISEPTRH